MGRLGRPLPSPYLDPLMALFDHLLTTDPERFLVAVRQPTPGSSHTREQVVGFGIAAQRENVWFLSQLYVLPSEQRHGIGHAPVSYTHLRAHETRHDLVCRLLLEKK